jgi:VWFA-related protein
MACLRLPGSSSAACIALVVFSALTLPSQNLPPNSAPVGPTFKAEARTVVVDVVVTDHKGQSVGGLRKTDFHIAEDGSSQIISGFEEHKGEHATPVKLPPMPPNVFTNFPTVKVADSVNVVLFDSLNTQQRDQTYVRDQLIKYLKDASPGTQVAIFVLGSRLRLIRGFTTDFSGLSIALDDKDKGARPLTSRYLRTPSQQASEAYMMNGMMSQEAIDNVKRFLQPESAELSSDRVEITLQAFQQLSRYLSSIPGRKNIIWFAGSFPINFVPSSDGRAIKHRENLRQTSDLFTAGQIAVYPVSATGILVDPPYDMASPFDTREELIEGTSGTQIQMETLAQETGGRAFYNTNALSEALTEAIENGSHYYTLAYTPADKKRDGKFRRIQVNLPEGNAFRLTYRRGYYADKPLNQPSGEKETADDPLIPLIGFGMPNFDQILYKVAVVPANPQPTADAARAGSNTEMKAPFTRYGVDFAISPQDLKLAVAPDGKRHGEIEIMLVAYDQDGKILNITKRKSGLALEPKVFDAMQKVGLQLHEEIDIRWGKCTCVLESSTSPPEGAALWGFR